MKNDIIEAIRHAEVARDRADNAIHRFLRSSRLDGKALAEINTAMCEFRHNLEEAARLAANLP